jgi:sugar O-acyltransferase (sialic acid O-acetyltransferase NeuD family)
LADPGVRLVACVGETADGSAELLGVPVLGSLDGVDAATGAAIIVAIGDNAVRRREWDRAVRAGYAPLNVVHPSAIVSPRCTLGRGVVIVAGAIVNVAASIGDNVVLNTACSVDHHCVVGAHAQIGPGARLTGASRVGELTFVGAGATILPGVRVGERCTIGANAVVAQDVPSGCMAVGVPARNLSPPQETACHVGPTRACAV